MEVVRQSGKPTLDIIRVLESMTPEQYALVNKMVKDELGHLILNRSPEMRRLETMMQVRANLKKTY